VFVAKLGACDGGLGCDERLDDGGRAILDGERVIAIHEVVLEIAVDDERA
jgi:hypothetical protein